MPVEPVKGSKRLLAVTQAVDPTYLRQLNRIDWLARPWLPDDHYKEISTFRRRVLTDHCDLMQAIDQAVLGLIPDINRHCNTDYRTGGSVWHICESNFVCPMHTDGHKPNVMIIYWQAPGIEWGTTFYNTNDPTDVWYEFPAVPGTGFFANYDPEPGEPWPSMWHASLRAVPENHYRLLTQYEFHK